MSKKKIAGITVGCIIAIIVVIGIIGSQEPSPTTETYTLTTSTSPSGAGSISPSGGEYEPGEEITLTANPASGYNFKRWSGSASGTTPTITITMDSNKSLTANFETIPTVRHNLTISVNGQGTTNPSVGTHEYDTGTQITITASPSSGWKFDHWSGDASDTSATVIVTMDSDKDITAYFEGEQPVTFEPIIFTGSSDKTTPPFEVTTDEWVIDWSYIPDPEYPEYAVFGFYIYPRGETVSYVESMVFPEDTSGSTYSYAGPGEYYVKVSSGNIESWEITIRPPS